MANSFEIHLTKVFVLVDSILVAAFGHPFVLLSEWEASHQTDPDFSRVKGRIGEEYKKKKKNHIDSINERITTSHLCWSYGVAFKLVINLHDLLGKCSYTNF